MVDKTVARFWPLIDVVSREQCRQPKAGLARSRTRTAGKSYAATFDNQRFSGVILSMKHEVPRDAGTGGSGSIINISSTYGHEGAAGGLYLCRQQSTPSKAIHQVGGRSKFAKFGRIRVNSVAAWSLPTPACLTRF